jgi:pimeloyl-ACP methyl ester carboxylesterase
MRQDRTLVLHGQHFHDTEAGRSGAPVVLAQPRARLVEIPDAGHTVPGDQPEVFNALVAAFLDEGRSGARA